MIDSLFYMSLLIFLGLIIFVILGLSLARSKLQPRLTRYSRAESGEYTETDLRLTYKRFKELYPYSQITYQEYKKLQAKKAFKRAVSSQKIERMVR